MYFCLSSSLGSEPVEGRAFICLALSCQLQTQPLLSRNKLIKEEKVKVEIIMFLLCY